ncbi:MAG: ChbG/HpnK family deacetylase [Alphaproteobacteria bacterium]|nr:ChbG/HpnK family deacetylase [Alphaproteobacteria bacterium]MDD9920037.1 ChbG/HpnK family deacetylase [Alphaproteobacteria bacterium]
MKNVMITADDYGLSGGICTSIIELLEAGAISATNVMACMPQAYERCEALKKAGLVSRVGVHLQVTWENDISRPLSEPEEVLSLVDERGIFKPVDCEDIIDLDELELEWDRQIRHVIDALGQTPAHLDRHHSIRTIPRGNEVYFKLAKKYGIPVRGGNKVGLVDGSAYGVQSTTLMTSDWTGTDQPVDVLKESILENLEKVGDGVLEIVTHPGYCDDELVKKSPWNENRVNDHKVLLELAKEGWLASQGIRLFRYEDF